MSKNMFWPNAPQRAQKRTTVVESAIVVPIDDNQSDVNHDATDPDNTDDKYVYKYSCAMLPLSEQTSSIIKYWTKVNVAPEKLFINEDAGMDGYESEPHVTVKYGIHDIEPDRLNSIVSGCGTINLTFGNVTKFDVNPDFDVLKIDVSCPELFALNKLISESMECTDTYPEYHPHVTLAYIKKGACSELINNPFFNKLNDTLNEMQFASRNGEDYWIDL